MKRAQRRQRCAEWRRLARRNSAAVPGAQRAAAIRARVSEADAAAGECVRQPAARHGSGPCKALLQQSRRCVQRTVRGWQCAGCLREAPRQPRPSMDKGSPHAEASRGFGVLLHSNQVIHTTCSINRHCRRPGRAPTAPPRHQHFTAAAFKACTPLCRFIGNLHCKSTGKSDLKPAAAAATPAAAAA